MECEKPYRVGSLMTATKELSKFSLNLVAVQKVRREGMAPNLQENIHFSMERGMRIMN
jgi:hypothetical protein